MFEQAKRALRAGWDEPAVSGAPERTPWDWVWVAVAIAVSVVDVLTAETSPVLRLVSLPLVIAALLLRRTHIWATLGLMVGVIAWDLVLLSQAQSFAAVGSLTLVTAYSIVRWGSGRQIAVAFLSVIPLNFVIVALDDDTDLAGAFLVIVIVLVVGLTIRQRANLAQQRLREAQLDERQRIARELHDSVAHHVSGIAVQARAAQAVVHVDPEAAADAMERVTIAASDALQEMRRMVTALREDGDAELRPQAGLAQIRELAERGQTAPRVEVAISDELGALEPALEAGLFRLAQESVTNASRHARHARLVTVTIRPCDDEVELVIVDDGETVVGRSRDGFGLVGMRERVALLGGSFDAGPGNERGWRVVARLPRGI